jgi:ketosteroid isomerase-like protein
MIQVVIQGLLAAPRSLVMIAVKPGGITMDASALVKEFCAAVERDDGRALAALFAEDGVYHDAFYGPFKGRVKIAELVDDWFHRTARDFRWEMFRPVSDGKTLYTYYTFSYVSILPEANGKRVGFDGVAMMQLRDGLITEYREVANTSMALLDIGFAPERVAKIVGKEAKHIKERPEWKRHAS